MERSEEVGQYSENAVEEFYDWVYSDQEGIVQVCGFPVPNGEGDSKTKKMNKYDHVNSLEGFKSFCEEYSGLWRYQVYAGVNTISEEPEWGRGDIDSIERVKVLPFDVETQRGSYQGSSKEDVWWSYQYALAQVKFISEEYGVWPMVVMSENGIHLHYRVDFPMPDQLIHGKQHIFSKFITHQAMNNRYVEQIVDNAPDSVRFSPDDVSDPPRVMKVPGTLGIKSQNGRLCGIIHTPPKSERGVIKATDLPTDKVEEFNEQLDEDNTETVNVEAEVDNLNSDLEARVEHLCQEDDTFKALWEGKTLTYDSRSEAEFAFTQKLLGLGFTESETQQVLTMSGMTKWNEEGDHYKRKTMEQAISAFDGEVTKDRNNGEFSFRSV